MKNGIRLIVCSVIFASPLCLAERPDDPNVRRGHVDSYCEGLLRPATPDGSYDDGSSLDEQSLEFGAEPNAYDSGEF